MWPYSSRSWMYNRWDPQTNNLSSEYMAGVAQFTAFASAQQFFIDNNGTYCPCTKCKNRGRPRSIKTVSNHLFNNGFMDGYYVWTTHGEDYNVSGIGSSSNYGNIKYTTSNPDLNYDGGNNYVEMVENAFYGFVPCNVEFQLEHNQSGNDYVYEEPNLEARNFYQMLDAANTPLYDGCQDYQSPLALATRIMNIKADHNLSESCIDSFTGLISEFLPQPNKATDGFYETEKMVKKLGLPVKRYDVCEENCMIFWKEDKDLEYCKFCGKGRYRMDTIGTKVGTTRMWYLPIGDRLKRMYQSEKTAAAMRWHAEHESQDGIMCHPSDAAEWRNFDQIHPEFAHETRNVRLGLCTDGFNPFGMHKNHSLWPVILTPYNLPPDMCMNEEYLFLTVLNSGPKHPRGSLDVFLQPLIEELKELWINGVTAYNVSKEENFNMKAVLLWTISDYPAYAMLSGWKTHRKLSCPVCMDETSSFYLKFGRKTCWFDCHRKFLPQNHLLRRNRVSFRKGKHAVCKDYPPESVTGAQLHQWVKSCGASKTSEVGGNGHEKKPPGYGDRHNWHKESIFWELPYWIDLNLRHCLYVMHIEKNFFDNIMYTVMNVLKKTKDTLQARRDLETFCSRSELHVDDNDNAPFPIWRLTVQAIDALLDWAKNEVKFPEGYAANLSGCADKKARIFAGMKSHDCHVFMERLLPFVFAELLPRNVHEALSGIGAFFRDLSSRSLEQSRLGVLKKNIVILLCNLEKIFPPSFFDVMEHLPIHLPYEAELGGPVQYRWMYPFERYFKHLKGKATNKYRPSGTIVESYKNEEISNFSQHYFPSTVSTAQTRRVARYKEGKVPVYGEAVPEIFTAVGRPGGKCSTHWLSDKEYEQAHATVLRNCAYFEPLERYVDNQIRAENPQLSDAEVIAKRDKEFPNWVNQYVTSMRGKQKFLVWVHDISSGPVNKVKLWKRYFTRGYMFHTRQHGERRQTRNYGVCVRGQNYADASVESDFYGTVEDIIELRYPESMNLRVIIFYCHWYDPSPRGTRISPLGVVDVLSSRKYDKYDPYILGSQADQVVYLPYPNTKRPRKVWLSVLQVNPRSRVQGKYVQEPIVTMQQTGEQNVTNTTEEIIVDSLVYGENYRETIDLEINDADADDEFRCNESTSGDEDENEPPVHEGNQNVLDPETEDDEDIDREY